jgi:uncharacterized protein (TIGR02300 family)
MATKAAIVDVRAQRGTKRTCQNEECGARFYDLNRDPIACPICGTVYTIVLRAVPEMPARVAPKVVKKPVVPHEIEADASSELKEEVLVAEEGEEEPVAGDDDTFLEEVEEETPDVTAIVDAPIDPDEKT